MSKLMGHIVEIGKYYAQMSDEQQFALQTLFGFACSKTCAENEATTQIEELPSPLSRMPPVLSKSVPPGEIGETAEGTFFTDLGGTTLADEIMNLLPKMLEQYPKGPTMKQVASWMDADPINVRQAFTKIASDGRAVTKRRGDTHALHLTPLGYESPPEDLTAPQAQVLRALDEAEQDGVSPYITYSGLATSAGVSQGGIRAIVSALAAKKAIKIVEQTTQGVMAQVLRRPA
ncbi:MAG: hypothetical protein KGZ68_01015 [Dechloromonas sp.]|nr:hypothetical protein [Dechloromonas sp.]